MAKILNQEIVRSFIENPNFGKDLVYCRQYDIFYNWNVNHYVKVTPDQSEEIMLNFLHANYPNQNLTMQLAKDILTQVKRLCYRRVDVPDTSYIALEDGYLSLLDFEISPHDQSKIVVYHLPYSSEQFKTTSTPNFLQFLMTSLVKEDSTETDDELLVLTQEMFGYFLLDTMKGAGAFFLVGDGSNGKSVMANIMTEMVGEQYCSAMSIQSLTTDKFKTAALVGIKLNVSNEEESKFLKSDKFKALVVGDPVDAEWKFGATFTIKPTTKYIFCSNNMPTFSEINYGLERRIKIIPFYRRFEDHEQDKQLPDKLHAELPGIIGWAIEGAKRFIKNGYNFSKPQASLRELQAFKEEISSSIRFFNQCYRVDDDCFNDNDTVYKEYQAWCNACGKKHVNLQNFYKDLMKNIKGLKSKVKYIDGTSKRGKNISWQNGYNPEKPGDSNYSGPIIESKPQQLKVIDLQDELSIDSLPF